MTVREVSKCKSGSCYAAKTAMIRSLPTIAAVFPRTYCGQHKKKHDKRESRLFREGFRCYELLCFCTKTSCCRNSLSNKINFSSNGLNKQAFEDSEEGPLAKCQKVSDKTKKVFSTNRGFRTKNHCVATYEQTKKNFSYCYPKQSVESDGIHSPSLHSLEV